MAAPLPSRITVDIGSRRWTTVDAGRTWTESARPAPPVVEWDGVRFDQHVIGEEGLGLASAVDAALDPDRPRALLFLTRDGGASWASVAPALSFLERLRASAGWPPEEIHSLAVHPGGLAAFTWEDPWLHDGPRSHLVVSTDGGESWRYARVPSGCIWLAASGDGLLRAFGFRELASTADAGRSIQTAKVAVSWPELPPRPERLLGLVRHVHMSSASEGVGLVLCQEDDLESPLVGLACSDDRARTWTVVRTWPTARDRDLNARGLLALTIPR